MVVWRWMKTVLLGLWAVESLLLRVGWIMLTVWWSKYWAVRSYQRELLKSGLPRSAVYELVTAYDMALSDLVRLGWRKRGRMLTVKR